jgi:hypothetical protein
VRLEQARQQLERRQREEKIATEYAGGLAALAGQNWTRAILAFEHDGALKWTSATIENVGDGGPAIVNVDGAGLPEIVVGRQVLNATAAALDGVRRGWRSGPPPVRGRSRRGRLARDRGRQQRRHADGSLA